jgi:cyclic di-GMP phosphodiesterase
LLRLSQEACAEVEAAALLHDIGKLALPEDVLSGRAPIGDAEMAALLDSPARTMQLLAESPALVGASQLIHRSREWWDGSGGPEGLRGWDIPIGARILAVADAIETAQDCEGREPHARASMTAAVSRRAGTRFDPDLVHVGLQANESRSCC